MGVDTNASMNKWQILGSFNFGMIYDMPHSPELSLTLTREYDGISHSSTSGGHHLTNIRYDGPPKWRNNAPPWTLHRGAPRHQGESEGFGDVNTDETYTDRHLFKNKPSRGRRIWKLKFSYLNSSDIFAINENVLTYTGSGGGSTGMGDAEDFLEDGYSEFQLQNTIQSDNSFLGIVMDKTMGGNLPFIFQPDNNNNAPDQFAICIIDQDSISFKQVASNVYDVSLTIKEIW